VCLAVGQKCKARYERVYKKKGFDCANGRLRRPAPPPPPSPPPAPLQALPGTYQFATSHCVLGVCDLGTIVVRPDGRTYTGVVIPYSAQCTPPYDWVDVVTSSQGAVFDLGSDLSFDVSGQSAANGVTLTVALSGQFDAAGNVFGSFDFHLSGNDSAGTHYDCDTGRVTFSGKLRT
jgi:hypothetical protein